MAARPECHIGSTTTPLNSKAALTIRGGMKTIDIGSKLGLLVCTSCRSGSLNLNAQGLQCADCGTVFRIERKIPRFVRSEDYAGSFGFQWNEHARTQLDSFTSKSIS